MNGFLSSDWAARLPEIEKHFNISHAQLGYLLLLGASGAIAFMPFVGFFTSKYSSKNITKFTGLLFSLSSCFLVVFDSVLLAGVVFFFMGMSAGALDVSMNAQAVFVERERKAPLMSSFHGMFSVGMTAGAGMATLFTSLEVPLFQNFLIAGLIGFTINLIAGFYLIEDPPHSASPDTNPVKLYFPTKAVLPFGVIAFCGMLGESSITDWSAIYVSTFIKENTTFSALAFASFSALMTIGRFTGDKLKIILGSKKLLLLDGFLGIFGLALPLFVLNEWTAIVGFGIAGFGISTIAPTIYSISGNVDGVLPSVGIAMITTIGYAGFFVGPPIIGYLGDTFGLRLGLCFTLAAFFVMLAFIVKTPFKEAAK